MKRILLTLSAIFFVLISIFAQGGHEIKIRLNDFDQKQLFLGYHYGDNQYLKDTVEIDASGYFTFKGEEPLDGGVYLVIMPPDNQYFQIVLDEGQQVFSIETSAKDPVSNIKVNGSSDNKLLYEYLNFLSGKIVEQKELSKDKDSPDEAKKTAATKKLEELDGLVKKYQSDLIKDHPKTMSAIMVKSNLANPMPNFEGTEEEKSMKRYVHYKKHYFDNIDLADPRMLRTPFLSQRVSYYMEKLTPQNPDSMIMSIDYLLAKMKPAEETFKYYLIHFLNKYARTKVVGEDKVYVHIAENYYCKGLAPWTEEEQLAKICDNARRLKPILIGKKARDVKTRDKEGTSHNLYDFDSEFTILYFWASDCGHCKKMTPFLIDFNEKYKSKGVSIMTICKPKTGNYKECWDYIDEHDNMENMLNTYDPSNRAQIYYNVRSTPSMFILNKDKEIIMKGIGADQLDEVMDKIIKREQQKNAPKE